jgi:hypothetical protein
MEDVSPFVTHFARLVWLIAHRPADHDGHKEQLRHALMQLSAQPQHLALREISLAVAEVREVPDESAELVRELAMRMAGHSVRLLEFEAALPAREVVEIAKALSSEPAHGDEGAAFDEKVIGLHLTGVTAHLGASGFVRHATPGMMPAFESSMRARTPSSSLEVRPPSPGREARIAHAGLQAGESQAMMQSQLMPMLGQDATLDDLMGRLDHAVESPASRAVVDDVARVTEDFASRQMWDDVVRVLDRMLHHHNRLHDGDVKRAFTMGIRRLQRPAILQGVAELLISRRDLRETCTRVLSACGETGADVLIDNLIGSEVPGDRRVFLEALRQCPAAVSSLLHLLSDDRWYVVRNAASLLGELRPLDADRKLVELMSHRETRVRQAAAIALGRLGTSRSVLALLQGLNDSSADVRAQSVWAIASARNPRAVPWLIEALDNEQDHDVQAALVSALGAVPTEDGVARLVLAAEAGGMLIRKPSALRLRAIEALAQAATPSARHALQRLTADRDRDIRTAAEQAVGKLSA